MGSSTTSRNGRHGPVRRTTPRPRRSGAAVLTSVLAVLALAACGADAPEPPPPITVTPTIEASRTTPPEPDVPVVWPLTGMPTDEVAQRPAVAVKIENTTSARPQSGLDSADVVWETIVEFDVSRLVAVFHSQVPDEVGPIRSVRPMDATIVAPLNGMFAFSGGQSGILAMVRDSGAQIISHDGGAPGMYRVGFRTAPHNVYGSMSTWLDTADSSHSEPPPEQFVFAHRPALAGAARAGEPATSLSFRLSGAARPSWTWDEGAGAWLRSESGTPASDRSGARLSAANVVSITAPHVGTRFRAQGGASVPTYELTGEGPALVASGGMVVEGTWRKESDADPLRLFLPDGSPLMLAPGNTWVELVPASGGSVTVD